MDVIIIGNAWERLEWMVFILTTNIFVRGYYLRYINFLSLIIKEPVIVSAVIPVHVSGKQGGIKEPPVLTPWINLQIPFSKKPIKPTSSSFISCCVDEIWSKIIWKWNFLSLGIRVSFVTCLFRPPLISKIYYNTHIWSLVFSEHNIFIN